MLRVLSGAVEAANVVERAEAFAGGHDAGAPYDLGPLATAWPRLSRAGTPAELRRVLAASPWGDPGGESPREIALAVRLTVADRVIAAVPPARAWAAGWAALVVARELAARRELPPSARTAALRVLGPAASAAVTVSHLMAALPSPARRLLGPSGAPDGPQEPDDLWRAEAGWWRVVEHDAAGLVRRATPGPEVLVGAVALLAVDAWRLRAALEIAARGGRGLEVFDAVA